MGPKKSAGPARRGQSVTIADSLLEASPVGTALLDGELCCIRVNSAFAALGGFGRKDARGRPLGDVAPCVAPRLGPLLRMTLDTGMRFVNIEIRGEPPDASGRRCWLVSSFPVHDPALAQAAVGATVVERAAEDERAALQDREALFRAIFEHAAIGILVVEWRGQTLRSNAAFREMLGYSEEELASVGVQAMTHPDDFAADLELFQRLMSGEIDHYRLAKRYLRKDGSVMWGQLVLSLARDPAGQPSLIIAMIEDVTRRRLAEQERDGLIQSLEEAVRAREVFLSIASHELKTPLTPLLLNLQLLKRKLSRTEAPLASQVDKAIQQTQRLASLVGRLLDVSRIAAGRFTQELAPLDLSELSRDVVERFRPAAELAGCALRLEAPEPVPVLGDFLQIEAVITNLLANAMKFGSNKPIDVVVGRRDGVARLSVHDRGIGVAPEQRERIFEQFSRAVSEMQYGGLGLGLYIAQQVVHAHGGRIWVESEPGAGATFIVELPGRS